MKSIIYKITIISYVAFISSSCTSLLYTSLDILRPAKVTFAPEIKNVLLVNNTVKQPSDYGHKNEFINEKAKNISLNTDSLSIFCLGALKEELNQKEFFSSITLNANSINKSRDFFSVNHLVPDLTKALCTQFNVDAILSLDKIKVNDIIKEYFIEDENTFLSNLEVRYETQWSIHSLKETTFTAATFKDTVYWESKANQRRKATLGLPIRTDALIDGALYVGQHTVSKFIPYWEKVDRYFFKTSNKYINRGLDSVFVKNWKSAISSWETALNKSISITTKAKAANNIAIAYEILGDIDQAYIYAEKSVYFIGKMDVFNLERYLFANNYAIELKKRKNEITLLNKQLGK